MGTFPDVKVINTCKKLAVSVQNVRKTYGPALVLDNISMNVEEGIVYGLLGSSGCGKTTILSCIVGLKSWDSGEISVMGNPVISGNSDSAKDIGFMPQDVALYEQLTVSEMLLYYSKLYHMTSKKYKEQISMLEELLNLPGYGKCYISNLSGGTQRRVSLALTLLSNPRLLILDEPTVGLDPLLRENIWQYLYNLAKTKNTTIIITTHYIEEVKKAHKVGVMRKGTLLVEDNPATLMQLHNTSILEEVVLEICRKDRNNRRKSYEMQARLSLVGGQLQSVKVSNLNTKLCKWLCLNNKHDIQNDQDAKAAECTNELRQNVNKSNSKNDSSIANSIQNTLAFSKIVWINFMRHYMFIFMLVFLPPFQLFSTGVVIGVEPKYTPIGVVNYEVPNWESACSKMTQSDFKQSINKTCDLSMLSCDLIKYLSKGTHMKAIGYETTEDARTAVTRGDLFGYIEIPANYSGYIVDRAVASLFADNETVDGTTVKLHLDMSEFITVFVVLSELFKRFEEFVKDFTTACDFRLGLVEIPFLYREPVFGSMDGTARDYMLPGLIAGVIFEIAFAVTPMIFINDVKQGTLDRSRVAGLKFTELIAGLFLTITSVSVVQSAICYISLQYGLGFEILGTVGAYLCLCLVTTFCGGALGLAIGIYFKDIFMLVLVVICIIPLLVIYAGILRPIEIIPNPYRWIVFYFFPVAGIVEPYRFIMNRGVSLTHPRVWPGLLVTVAWGVAFCLICLILLRKMKR